MNEIQLGTDEWNTSFFNDESKNDEILIGLMKLGEIQAGKQDKSGNDPD